MHSPFQQLEIYHLSSMDRQFLRTGRGITLFLFSVVMCFCKDISQQSIRSVQGFVSSLYEQAACQSAVLMYSIMLVHLQDLTQFSCGKMENTHSILPASHCLMGRLKPIQTKIHSLRLELVDGETTRAEQLSQLCHQTTLSLISVSRSPPLCIFAFLSLPCAFGNISHGSLLPLLSCV